MDARQSPQFQSSVTELATILSLEQQVRHQSSLLSDLKGKMETVSLVLPDLEARMERMSLAIRSPQCTPQADKKWLTTQTVISADSVLSRMGDIDDPHFAFRTTRFTINSSIDFSIIKTDKVFVESISFGVCKYPPSVLKLESLPCHAVKLSNTTSDKDWILAGDIMPDASNGRVIRLRRTSDAVTMKTTSGEKELFPLQSDLEVFPFFLFDGCVKTISLIRLQVRREREGLECLVCHRKSAAKRAKPCNHHLYCDGCFEAAVVCTDGIKCPLCDGEIRKWKQVRLD